MPPSNPHWLDIVRHRVRGFRAPYLLVLQHHVVPATTRLVAPVTPPVNGDNDILAPPLWVDGDELRARLLDLGAVPVGLLGDTIASAVAEGDAILNALDILLRGYPVGIPH